MKLSGVSIEEKCHYRSFVNIVNIGIVNCNRWGRFGLNPKSARVWGRLNLSNFYVPNAESVYDEGDSPPSFL